MNERSRLHAALAALASLGTALAAALQSGRTHPDEVYQFLEPANRLAFGFGFPAWEWQEGLRNWVVPGALAAGMRLVHALGHPSAMAHRLGAAAVVALFAYPGMRAVLRYAARRTTHAAAPPLALGLVLGWALSLYFLGRTMGEPMGTLFVIAGIEALDRDEEPLRAGALAGLWLGLSVVVRYSFAALVVAVLLTAVGRARWRQVAGAVAAGAAVALALGLLDLATWGSLFHSMRQYLAFNLSPAVARKFGAEPPGFFLPVARDWLPWPLLLGLPWMAWRRERMLLPAALCAVALTATAHKEPRFLFPVVLLVTVALAPAAAQGLCALWRRTLGFRLLAALGLGLFAAGSAWAYRRLPDLESDLFRATMRAGADPGLDQLIVVNESRWGCGGSFYVGRDVNVWYTGPGYPGFTQAMATPAVNRAVVFRSPRDQAELERYGFRVVDTIGATTVLAR